MRLPSVLLALVVAGCAGAQASSTPAAARDAIPALDSAKLLGDLFRLSHDSMAGRAAMTPENAKARAYLVSEMRRLGLAPVGASFEQPFAMPRRNRPDSVRGVNVVAQVRGTRFPERAIVVSAHFDHVAPRNGNIYNGADDNASGTAALLQLAAHFQRHKPEHTLIFAFFDAEEMGLLGARAFVANPPVPLAQIAANVNMDMVARGDNGTLWAVGTNPHPVMKPIVEALVPASGVTVKMGYDTGTGRDNWTSLSDQGAFHAQGIPFVYFGVEDHADYHEPTDDPEKVNAGWYYNAARTIAAFVTRLDVAVAGWPPR
ncbi:M20/M25/M40 family metallo-hydrolase [Pseudogemmatithrix spongiicola]|uniref:M20/M25/M40 family metallo-hydrolase n=1 Tax=Pseudogemmatithrix spongiicola TaxID=3062599 RepID=A0AA49Q5L4_9BACT|nr:M20/M25/M40 family metallo-hydrolase [Gemmatimonadaceae bacterium 'strain 138']WKW15968.1 M20/M25/M40 family metallo-hydrolase [Gemmatimonadaceae bacterium 'strain 318']